MSKVNASNRKDERILYFIYNILPYILMVPILALSIVRVDIMKKTAESGIEYSKSVSITGLLNGDPNLFGLLGSITMILCFLVVPKQIKKYHKSGDGLGIMFMPLGLLCLFEVMSSIENKRMVEVGIVFGILLFVMSALGTFKKTIGIVNICCIIMAFAAIFLFLAGYSPYCYNSYSFYRYSEVTEQNEHVVAGYYYLSYFIRDVLLIFTYGLFSERIKRSYDRSDRQTDKGGKKQ